MNHKIRLCFTLLLGFVFLQIQAQQATVVAGGSASGSGGKVSYSIGQVGYTTNTGTAGSVAQGTQQPFEILTMGVDNYSNITLKMVVFPNPTTEFVTLQIANLAIENLEYQVFDFQGRLIENKEIATSETRINMQNLPSATYLVKISDKNKLLKTFKIIKN